MLLSECEMHGHILQSIAARKTEDMLGKIAEDQVGADWGNGVQARFAELSFDVIFFGKAKAAVRLHAHVGGGPAGF